MFQKMLRIVILAVLVLGIPANAVAQEPGPQLPQVDVSSLAIPEDQVISTEIAPELRRATGPVQVVVRLTDAPLAKAVGPNAKQNGFLLKAAKQRAYLDWLGTKQDALLEQISALGGQTLGQVSKALNAVIVEIDASMLEQVAGLPNVASIHPVINYELDLSETVPYIGAAALQMDGVDGTGVRVAVLDSGIDYTHKNLGGSGNVTDFDDNNPDLIEPGTFPTWKVVGGYDFVGSNWPNGPLAPDPDPLDKGAGAGHGTHVSDIIAGKSLDGTHVGTAPGASLYAVKVCSSVSTSCSGTALLEGMDFALDPNGDGDISDAVDVINMSLGSNYGQYEDDLSAASTYVVNMGVVVVAAAGNAADRPYIVSSPSTAPAVISVAQTQVPSAIAYPLVINSPASIAGSYTNTATVDWAPIGAGATGDVAYVGRGCPAAGTTLDDPYLSNPAGKIALIDRGLCAISLKVDRAAKAGATGVLLALSAAGDAVTFSFGGGDTMVPTLVIIKSYGDMIKAAMNAGLVVNATVSPTNALPLVKSMVGSSARGPSYSYNSIKPDIGAPGASVSAIYGTGDGEGAFGGTSGATPMVSGSAALLIQKFTGIAPLEVKTRLMNTAETEIYTNPATLPGELAPITRIGGGEVRVNLAAQVSTVAWDAQDLTGSLSFGYAALTGSTTFQKTVAVHNYTNKVRTYTIIPGFRYADDEASGAVTIKAPAKVKVGANSTATFKVQLHVDVTKLPIWNLDGGPNGGNGALLQGVEFDGYIHITDGSDDVHLAWQILPQRSAEVTPASTSLELTDDAGMLDLSNAGGAVDGGVDVFSLVGTSGRIPPPLQPQAGDNYAIIDLKSVGVRQADSVIQFAINTFGTRAHPNYPAEFDVFLDTNRDGVDDFVLYNAENGGFGASGQAVVYVANLATGRSSGYYYVDADLNSSNVIFTAPLAALGMTSVTQFNISVYACDNYFTGLCTDAITGMTYTLGAPRYYLDEYQLTVPQGGSMALDVYAIDGGETASPSQSGLLLMYRDARQQRQADAIFIYP